MRMLEDLGDFLQLLSLKATITYDPNEHVFICEIIDGTRVVSNNLDNLFNTLIRLYHDCVGEVFE